MSEKTTLEYLKEILMATKDVGVSYEILWCADDAESFISRIRMALSRVRKKKKQQSGKVFPFVLKISVGKTNSDGKVNITFVRHQSSRMKVGLLMEEITKSLGEDF